MTEPWTPALRLHESAGRCRLTLEGVTSGQGQTLQEAADELVGRLLTIVTAVRHSGYRYPAELISYAVWLYFRFPLSLRMVEEMLAARGISVTYETIRQWGLKFGRRWLRVLVLL